MTPKFMATIKQVIGKNEKYVRADNPHKLHAYIAGFPVDTRIEIVIKKWRKTRSNPQNRYYHGIVVKMLADHFGYTPDEMHFQLKYLFLNTGTPDRPKVGSTTKLDTKGMMEYIDKIVMWAAQEYQVVIPDPDEVYI